MRRLRPFVCSLLTVGALASGAALNAAPLAFVTNQGPDNVTVLDLETGKTLATIAVGKDPAGVAWDARHRQIFISNPTAGSVSVIAADRPDKAHSFATGQSPLGIATDPTRDRLYVADFYSRRVDIFSTRDFSRHGHFALGNAPSGLGEWELYESLLVRTRPSAPATALLTPPCDGA